ncbi:MAG TPA: hypothetical protein P5277_02200 [Candidatus Paceibacterota bacterium]|nr:hypothetical protein [Candidatus Paceibacterota bacterium]
MTKDDSKLKMAIIVGAAEALKIKSQNPNHNDSEVIHQVNKRVDEIIANIDY